MVGPLIIVGLGTLIGSLLAGTLGGVAVGGAIGAGAAKPAQNIVVEDGGNVNTGDPGNSGGLGSIMTMIPQILMLSMMMKFMN